LSSARSIVSSVKKPGKRWRDETPRKSEFTIQDQVSNCAQSASGPRTYPTGRLESLCTFGPSAGLSCAIPDGSYRATTGSRWWFFCCTIAWVGTFSRDSFTGLLAACTCARQTASGNWLAQSLTPRKAESTAWNCWPQKVQANEEELHQSPQTRQSKDPGRPIFALGFTLLLDKYPTTFRQTDQY
jgi:hypothetical protein